MRNDILTDAQVDTEIERLNASPHVKLARKERSVRYARRRYLYDLRRLEQRGKELAALGYTLESLEALNIREDELDGEL